jgi:hypothetical protein
LKKNIEDYIFHKENFLDKEYCEKSISELKICEWTKHELYTQNSVLPLIHTDPKVGDLLQAGVIGTDSQEKAENINELIIGKVSSAIQEYIGNLNFIWFRGWEGYSSIKFIRYLPGQEMTVHCDFIHSMFDGVRKGIPILSIIGHLNDDYEGGETYFFEDKKIDTKQGDLLIFPSSFLYPHYVTPVTKGVRYSYVSWVW